MIITFNGVVGVVAVHLTEEEFNCIVTIILYAFGFKYCEFEVRMSSSSCVTVVCISILCTVLHTLYPVNAPI